MFNFHETVPGSMAWAVTSTHPGIEEGVTPWDVFEPYAEKERDINLVKAVMEMSGKEDLQHPICNRVILMPNAMDKGWGGRGRVALLGDSAHAMRPINGLGGSMAFEDGVVLCRLLRDPSLLADREATQELISKFENMRLPRVKRIWDDQWNRAERVYAGEKYEQWSKEYKEWVYSGV
jgi:2-polyprenyl-6-methoxyphenol hydroxylase-like FAD-dependent oxidoreductase